jgi:YfiH family protein
MVSYIKVKEMITAEGLSRCAGVEHLFGTRWIRSAAQAARHLGLPPEETVTVRQVHGDSLLVVDSAGVAPDESDEGHDGILTDRPGILLAVATADCVPILMADPETRTVAAVHAGWRGSLKRIAPKAVETMRRRFGAEPENLRVAIGPSAGPCCYEVNGVVLDPLKRVFRTWRSVVRETPGGKGMLDLRSLNRLQLMESGVQGSRIETIEECTVCRPDRYDSYRREGPGAGRMFSGIVLR